MKNYYELSTTEVRERMKSYHVGYDTVAVFIDGGVIEYKAVGNIKEAIDLSLEIDDLKKYANLDMTWGSVDRLDEMIEEIENKKNELDKLEEEIMLESIKGEIIYGGSL